MRLDPYIAGLFYGDGCLYRRKDGAYCVWVDQTEKNKDILKQEALSRLKKMRIKFHFYSYYAKRDGVRKWRILIYSKELYMLLREVFQRITEYFENLPDTKARQFIAALFDAEGTKTDRIVIYNQNVDLLKRISIKLDSLGIKDSHIYSFGQIYGLQIYRKSSLNKFLRLIPSHRLKAHLPG